MERFLKIWVLLLSVMVCSCSSKESGWEYNHNKNSGYGGGSGYEKYDEVACEEADDDIIQDVPTVANKKSEVVERKLIKEGEIEFETTDAKQTREKIANIVSDCQGYISKDRTSSYTYKMEYNISIRVPAAKFDLLLNTISESAEKLDKKNIRVLDVTEEFIDIESRVKTKKELEERYKELLKKANKVEEILSIEREIGSLRTEIESIEGRFKYLQDRVSYSTLSVSFYEKIDEKTNTSFGFVSKFTSAIKDGWNIVLWCIIGLTNLWAFLLLGMLVVFGIKYLRKRRKKRKNNE